jgi:glycosyltransferase involved in cell wall biosynthesis
MAELFSSPTPPLVSAIIPTRGRPALLAGAVRSALRQTWRRMEVVVVVDGPDAETAAYLEGMTDPRVRVLFLEAAWGAGDARNAGVRAAQGEWIALLDDDDEWLPDKIEQQMRAVRGMRDWFPVVSTRVLARSASAARVLPAKPYHWPQSIGDFLFCRSGLGDSGGVMQTSTLLAPRDLLLAIPFQSGLPMHQDWDWLIRVGAHEGVGFAMVRKPLTVWRVEDGRATVGQEPDWEFSLAWIRSVRKLISPRAFAWFVAVQCAWRAQASHAGVGVRLRLLRALLGEGRPELQSLAAFAGYSLVPGRIRRWVRDRLARYRGSAGAAGSLRLVYRRTATQPVLRRSIP